jgi:hypothetical protein
LESPEGVEVEVEVEVEVYSNLNTGGNRNTNGDTSNHVKLKTRARRSRSTYPSIVATTAFRQVKVNLNRVRKAAMVVFARRESSRVVVLW